LPDGPLLLVANEFLDALPIRQLVRRHEGWAERFVGLDVDGRLAFVDGPASPALRLLVPEPLRESTPGTIVEICSAAAPLGGRLGRAPGGALLIVYGYFPNASGPTLMAISRHRSTSVLDDPGAADLSAHVDFAAVATAARAAGAAIYGPEPQGRFLRALG